MLPLLEPLIVVAPASCTVRVSIVRLRLLAPVLIVVAPWISVLPVPLSVPLLENVAVPAAATVNVPAPVSVPPDCEREAIVAVLLFILNWPPDRANGPCP